MITAVSRVAPLDEILRMLDRKGVKVVASTNDLFILVMLPSVTNEIMDWL